MDQSDSLNSPHIQVSKHVHTVSVRLMVDILLSSTCRSSNRLTAREKLLLANDKLSSVRRRSRRCLILDMSWETSPMEGRFLGDLCKHLCPILASCLTSSRLHFPTSFLSSISSIPSWSIAALQDKQENETQIVKSKKKKIFFQRKVTYKVDILHQVLMRVDGSDELKNYDAKTVYVTLSC